MPNLTGLTRGGNEWTPAFITELNQGECIGCGRCFKVCSRDVFELIERDEELIDDDDFGDDDFYADDDDFSDDTLMVMSLKNVMDCIGCEACYRVCSKKCIKHAPLAA